MWQACRYCGSFHQPRQCLAFGKVCIECNKTGHFCRVCRSKKSRPVHEVEQEIIDNEASEDIETVNVHSVQLNVNQSIITASLKMLSGRNSVNINHKIDMGSDGNIMPTYLFIKLFPNVTNEQLVATVNKCILLKTYNKTTITELRTCKLIIEHKNIKKHVNSL